MRGITIYFMILLLKVLRRLTITIKFNIILRYI